MVFPGKEELRIALENFTEEDITLHRNILLHDLLFVVKFFRLTILNLEISSVFQSHVVIFCVTC